MIRNIDDNVGKLEKFLESENLVAYDNTIVVIFLTDNGSTLGEIYYPAGMRGKKTQLWEGGHRVPCFLRWPGGPLGQPRDLDGLTQVQDLLPTILELAGVESDAPFDGLSLVPALRGTSPVPEERMLVINYSRMPQGFQLPGPGQSFQNETRGRRRSLEALATAGGSRTLRPEGGFPCSSTTFSPNIRKWSPPCGPISMPGGMKWVTSPTSRNPSSSATRPRTR